MPARGGIIYAIPRALPTPIIEEPQELWNGKCVDLSERCSSLPSSDCESLSSSGSFSEGSFSEGSLSEGSFSEGSIPESSFCEGSISECDVDDFDKISIPDSELLCDPEGEQMCLNLLKIIKRSLNKVNINTLRCSKLLLPDDILCHLGKELMHLAQTEPCGLRGAVIDVCVESNKKCHTLAQLEVDPCVVPTFHMSVLFKLDSRLWPRIQGLFSTKPVPGSGLSMKLFPGFKVMKKKLYSSDELVIEEC